MKTQMMIIKTEFKLLMRNFFSVFFAVFFPVSMLLIFGEIYGNEPAEFYGNKGAMDVLVSAYICMVMAVTGIMSLPLTIAQYRERKILKRFRATPIKVHHILLSQVVSNIILTIIGISLLIIVGILRYKIKLYGNVFIVCLVGLLVACSTFSIGLLIAGVSKNGKSATAIANLVYFPTLFLSGATMPLEMFPKSLQAVSNLFPLTHGIKLLRGAWHGESMKDYPLEIGILLIIIAITTGIAIKFFKWE